MERFIKKQNKYFKQAYQEIIEGKKKTHWIWFIFPQIRGLGYSENSQYYGIKSLDEAKQYLNDKSLRENLIQITNALLEHDKINDIFDSLDCRKILSCMTLFNLADEEKRCENIFEKVMRKFFRGEQDKKTLEILGKIKPSNYHYYNDKNYFDKCKYDKTYQINNKEYPDNKKYKYQYIIEANDNNNRFYSLKGDKKNYDSFNHFEPQYKINQNRMNENLLGIKEEKLEDVNFIYPQKEIKRNYNERGNSTDRYIEYSNIDNVNYYYNNFNNDYNYLENNYKTNISNIKNIYDPQKTNIKGPIKRKGRSSSLYTSNSMRKPNFY